jgi:hypothetical protein
MAESAFLWTNKPKRHRDGDANPWREPLWVLDARSRPATRLQTRVDREFSSPLRHAADLREDGASARACVPRSSARRPILRALRNRPVEAVDFLCSLELPQSDKRSGNRFAAILHSGSLRFRMTMRRRQKNYSLSAQVESPQPKDGNGRRGGRPTPDRQGRRPLLIEILCAAQRIGSR